MIFRFSNDTRSCTGKYNPVVEHDSECFLLMLHAKKILFLNWTSLYSQHSFIIIPNCIYAYRKVKIKSYIIDVDIAFRDI